MEYVCSFLTEQARYGKKIMTKYEVYRTADTALADALLRTQNHWQAIEIEMQFLRVLSESLDEKLQVHLAHMFQKLRMKLQEAVAALDSVLGDDTEEKSVHLDQVLKKKGSINKMKLASSVKSTLDRVLMDMDHWHTMLLPYWFLLVLVKDPMVDHQLSTHEDGKSKQIGRLKELRKEIYGSGIRKGGDAPIFITDGEWIENRSPILYTGGELAQDSRTKTYLYIEHFTPHPRIPPSLAISHVRDLAHVLAVVDPLQFLIMACRGVIKVLKPSGSIESFQLLFQIPNSLRNPRSFREVLLTTPRISLDNCFRFAKQLALAVMFVHTTNFVHKNLRPETILLFQQDTSTDVGLPFLAGFQSFRPADGMTYLSGDAEWHKDIYRHPTRQGILPEDCYQMQHDIYSLGVCLLELGIWESLIIPTVDNGTSALGIDPNPNLNIASCLALERPRKARAIKEEFIAMARERLPSLMGPRYAKVVTMCLSCLDRDNNEFGHQREFLDEDGVLIGVRYIEKVCNWSLDGHLFRFRQT